MAQHKRPPIRPGKGRTPGATGNNKGKKNLTAATVSSQSAEKARNGQPVYNRTSGKIQ